GWDGDVGDRGAGAGPGAVHDDQGARARRRAAAALRDASGRRRGKMIAAASYRYSSFHALARAIEGVDKLWRKISTGSRRSFADAQDDGKGASLVVLLNEGCRSKGSTRSDGVRVQLKKFRIERRLPARAGAAARPSGARPE